VCTHRTALTRPVTLAAALVVTGVLGGCGLSKARTSATAVRAYDGPLYVARYRATHPSAGASGDAVDCRFFGRGGFNDSATYDEGATADSPEAALDTARSERIFEGAQDGLRVAVRDDDRVLYVIEVDGAIKQAVIVHDGPAAEGTGGPGWYVESWARCDWSELPPSVSAFAPEVWTDHEGTPVSTDELESYVGPTHCDWQSVVFLEFDGNWKRTYVRRPTPELVDLLAGPYREHVRLPADAVPTRYEREGDRLWLSADRDTAYVGSGPADVEAWPREVRPIGCD
jgi:hypothetical protein